MRIKQVSLYHKIMPMICGKFSCSLEPGTETADVVITRVETECGLVGYGEAGSVGGYPNYAAGTVGSSAELIERHLLDKDPRNINDIQYVMSLIDGHGAIKAGFDMACWDILGKSSGKPLYELLGGKLRDRVPIYRSIPTIEPEEMAQSVDDWRSEGYRMFQLRVGHGDIQADLQRIAGVIAKRKPGELFTVDVAGHWRRDEALYILNTVKNLDFTIEQPCWTMEDCMSIRDRTAFPLKLDNSLNGVQDVLRAYKNNACDSVVIQVNKYAGVTQAKFARDIAAAGGMGITYATQWGTEITGSVLVHLALTTPLNRFISTLDIHNYSSLTVATNDPIVVDNGFMWMGSDAPGLGVVVDDERLGEPDRVISR
ncbi:MAG: mandelate racemase/muconate lactonizing enzyme family protein [Thiothrix sp.]